MVFNRGTEKHNLQSLVKQSAVNTKRRSFSFTSKVVTSNYKSAMIDIPNEKNKVRSAKHS